MHRLIAKEEREGERERGMESVYQDMQSGIAAFKGDMKDFYHNRH